MTTIQLNDRLLRDALLVPGIHPSDADALAMSVQLAIRATRQRRRWLAPWVVQAGATESQRQRAAVLRVALATAVAIALLGALVLVGAALQPRALLRAPITFIRQGSVFQVNPFDHTVEPVRSLGGMNIASLQTSIAGRLLVAQVVAGPDGRRGLSVDVREPDGSVVSTLASPPDSVLTFDSLGWSPDGSQILDTVSVRGVHRLALFDPQTGAGTLVGPSDRIAESATWSPDGRSIAFRATTMGSSAPVIAVLDLSTGAVRDISGAFPELSRYPDGLAEWVPPTWSPDGQAVTFEVDGSGGYPDGIWIATADGRTVRRLTPEGFGGYPAPWSPDGKWLQLGRLVSLGSSSCTSDLYAMRPDGTELHAVLTNSWPAGWSPDSSWMLAEVTVKLDGPGLTGQGLPSAPYGGIIMARPDAPDVVVVLSYTREDATTSLQEGCPYGLSPAWQHLRGAGAKP